MVGGPEKVVKLRGRLRMKGAGASGGVCAQGASMAADELRGVLEEVRAGRLSVEAALERVRQAPVAELGYATVDLHRRQRCGFPEVIFCQGKTCEWVEGVVRKLVEAKQDCLATRVNEEQAVHLAKVFADGRQDRVGRTFWLPAEPPCSPKGV